MKPKLEGLMAVAGAAALLGALVSRADSQVVLTARTISPAPTQSHPCLPERVRVYSDGADRGADRPADAEGHDRTILWTGDDCFVLIRMAGSMTFNVTNDDVEMLEEGGRLEVMFEQGKRNGRYIVTNPGGRSVHREYIENGRSVSANKGKGWRAAMIRTLLVSPKLRNSFPDRPQSEDESVTRVSGDEETFDFLERWACDDQGAEEAPPIIAQGGTSR